MIENGYILLARQIDESDISRMSPSTRELWLYLLRKVNHTSHGHLKRGQGYFKLTEIRKDLAWNVGYRTEYYSKRQLTKSLQRLHECQMIDTTKVTHGTLVTICNYGHYQSPKSYKGIPERQMKVVRGQNSGSNKNKNEKMNEKNINSSFNNFWNLYNKKIGKKRCLYLWNRLSKDDKIKILVHAPKYVKSSPSLFSKNLKSSPAS